MFTLINYLYRDASNYKVGNTVAIIGTFTDKQKEAIRSTLQDGEFFIPRLVDLPETRFSESPTEDDHCFFELQGFNEVKKIPRIEQWDNIGAPGVVLLKATPDEVVASFQAMAGKWDTTVKTVGNYGMGDFPPFLMGADTLLLPEEIAPVRYMDKATYSNHKRKNNVPSGWHIVVADDSFIAIDRYIQRGTGKVHYRERKFKKLMDAIHWLTDKEASEG